MAIWKQVHGLGASAVQAVFLGLFAVLGLVCAGTVPALAERRVALVIGNGAYLSAGRLLNAANDAGDIGSSLKSFGFEVTTALDLDVSRFEEAVATFVARSRGADVALFFYAGHAIQLGNVNYLMPIDARLANEFAVKRETIAAQDIIEQLEAAARTTLVFLDACRNNPIAENLQRNLTAVGRTAAIGRGLARIDNRGRDTLIVYSAEPGRVAADGRSGARNSPFAASLLKHIDTPGLEIESLLKRVSQEVRAATENAQQPERVSKLQSEFYFRAHSAPGRSASDAELARLRAENERLRENQSASVVQPDPAPTAPSQPYAPKDVTPTPARPPSAMSAATRSYPARPLSLVVPFPAGGTQDVIARLVASEVEKVFGQPIVIQNTAGAGGLIAAETVAKAQPDGYTLLFTSNVVLVGQAVRNRSSVDFVNQFVHIALLATGVDVLVASTAVPAPSLRGLVDAARAAPGKFTYGSLGAGSSSHMHMEAVMKAVGVSFTHIPYRGSAAVLSDLVGAQIHLALLDSASVGALVRTNKLKVLAVSGRQPHVQFPGVPRFRDIGLGDQEAMPWHGVAAPAGTPVDLADKINAAFVQAASTPATSARLETIGYTAAEPSKPDVTQRFVAGEVNRWRTLSAAIGLKME